MMHWTFWTPCWPLSSVTPERLGRKTAPLAGRIWINLHWRSPACSYLLKAPDESIRAEVFSYIPRQKLAEIITLVREIARPSDDNFHEEMVEQYGRVRRFLPHLLNTVKFSSAPAGLPLNAYLSREFSSRRQF
ncbi:Putative transposase (identified by ISEscan HMM) [Escherichia coli]|nr:Putative transposase (identified by ISEscan HMM) [Escherichia coli]